MATPHQLLDALQALYDSAPGPSSGSRVPSQDSWIESELGRLIQCTVALDHVVSVYSSPLPNVFTNLLRVHGLSEYPSNEQSAKSILRHLLMGQCYAGGVATDALPVACALQRDLYPDCHGHLNTLFTYLSVDCEYTTPQLALVCRSLGMSDLELTHAPYSVSLRAFLQSTCDALNVYRTRNKLFVDTINSLDKLSSIPRLVALCRAHSIVLPPTLDSNLLKDSLIRHLCQDACSLSDDVNLPPSYSTSNGGDATSVQISLFTSVLDSFSRAHVRPLKRMLRTVDPDLEIEHLSKNEMKKLIRSYVSDLRKLKKPLARHLRYENFVDTEREHLRIAHSDVMSSWPRIVPKDCRDKCIADFRSSTSSDSLAESVCAICGESQRKEFMHTTKIPLAHVDVDRFRVNRPGNIPDPFIDVPCLKGAMLEVAGVGLRDPSKPLLSFCRTCHYSIVRRKSSRLPKAALANGLYTGNAPPELSELSVIEEAMIARRRAKCWVLHLNADTPGDSSSASQPRNAPVLATTQRGFRGHVAVYPADPKDVGSLLPPPLDEITRYACIVFVGSNKPSREWLLTKAKPLLIRPHKVRAALLWLKSNNPLYSDIVINESVLSALPSESVLPVDITHQLPTVASNAQGVGYDPVSTCSCQGVCTCPSTSDVYRSFLVSDVEGEGVSSRRMTAAALHHLHQGGAFIHVSHGSEFVNTYEDELLFPLLYPTLFPYGTGGFESSLRSVPISMQAHARHLFKLVDRRFQRHHTFLFTVSSILQGRAVSLSAKLKTRQHNFSQIANELNSISKSTLDSVLSRHIQGLPPLTTSPEHVLVSRLLREVSLVSSKVPGTSAARTAMRNEIRAMMFHLGLPSFYITVNPADVYNPLVKFLAGSEIDIDNLLPDQIPEYWEQAVLVANNPFVASKFFDTYMQAFFKHMIGDSIADGNSRGGILGHAKGYYGCVESQGRGTLHCHMLVWLDGALNPQEIKDRVLVDGDLAFRDRLLSFIDDVIQTRVPQPSPNPCSVPSDHAHPCSVRCLNPLADSSTSDQRLKDLCNLVPVCQKHVHGVSCYKYCKGPNEAKVCRYGLDEANHVSATTMDMETGELQYRVVNGMINNYCDCILEALRCNHDIKFIGSGASAKAILYYVTDYITKTPLKTHVAYAALQAAVSKLESNGVAFENSPESRAQSLLVKSANAIISNQELGGPQVASYLLGYDDKYTNKRFGNLYWRTFEGFIHNLSSIADLEAPPHVGVDSPPAVTCEPRQNQDDPESASIHESGEEDVDQDESESHPIHEPPPDDTFNDVVLMNDGLGHIVAKGNQCMDYRYRGHSLHNMCLWVSIARGMSRKRSVFQPFSNDIESGSEEESGPNECDGVCRLEVEHPEHSTHLLQKRRKPVIPVPIGPSLPRRDRPDIFERYCRLMLILFKPWKTLSDLRPMGLNWTEAFQNIRDSLPTRLTKIMDNMQLLHECKDSRDDHYNNRRASLIRGDRPLRISDDIVNASASVNQDDEEGALHDILDNERVYSSRKAEDDSDVLSALSAAQEGGVFDLGGTFPNPRDDVSELDGVPSYNKDQESAWRAEYERRQDMQRRLLIQENTETGHVNSSSLGLPSVSVDCLPAPLFSPNASVSSDPVIALDCVGQLTMTVERSPAELAQVIITDFNLNLEQEMAFRLVAESTYLPRNQPLRMYVGGPGGTGKSRVIDALRRFFNDSNQMRRFRLAAFMGVAAKNIEGVTLHSALALAAFMSSKGSLHHKQKLAAMWEGVDYLIIDEVSMVGCTLLTNINNALCCAKGNTEMPFGGINVIFCGDFAQLPPVQDTSLYASQKKTNQSHKASSTNDGQTGIHGRTLWLQLNECVMLHQSWRQFGDTNIGFRNLLQHLRDGACTDEDYNLLCSRILSQTNNVSNNALARSAPIITVRNAVKDALNRRCALRFAEENGKVLHEYYSQDFRKGVLIDHEDYANCLWNLDSGKTSQTLGRLPLVEGMPVFVTHNYDVGGGVVNGSMGVLKSVQFSVGVSGHRHATSCVVTIHDYSGDSFPGLQAKDVPVLAEKTKLSFRHPYSKKQQTVSRIQLPILPAFAMTDFKSQGRTLPMVTVDLNGCKGLQAPYVMLSRATSLEGVFILRPFSSRRIMGRLNEDLRTENRRLHLLHLQTIQRWGDPAQAEVAKRTYTELVAAKRPLPDRDNRPMPKRRRLQRATEHDIEMREMIRVLDMVGCFKKSPPSGFSDF